MDTWRVGPAALQVFLFNLYDHSITMLSSKNTGSMLIINPKKWSMLLSSTIAYCGKLDNILLFFWQLFFFTSTILYAFVIVQLMEKETLLDRR